MSAEGRFRTHGAKVGIRPESVSETRVLNMHRKMTVFTRPVNECQRPDRWAGTRPIYGWHGRGPYRWQPPATQRPDKHWLQTSSDLRIEGVRLRWLSESPSHSALATGPPRHDVVTSQASGEQREAARQDRSRGLPPANIPLHPGPTGRHQSGCQAIRTHQVGICWERSGLRSGVSYFASWMGDR
jgi:hypothetical protein